MAPVRRVSRFPLSLAIIGVAAGGCGAGQVAQAIRPADPTAWEATGESAGECRVVSDRAEPLIVDWPAHKRGDLEEAMHDGVAVVAYDCHSFRLLRGCRIDSTYGFMSFSRKEQTIRFDNADEVQANLPTFGIGLLQSLHGDLKAGSTLDLSLIMIGKERTTVREATRDILLGGPACEGATHFVRGAFVGAFAMGTGTRGAASLGANLFSAGSTSTKLASYRDGDPGSCQQVARDASDAPSACDALLRLELVALGSTSPGDVAAATCSAGLVLTDGKCTRPTADRPHQCDPGNLADCTEQCDKKHAGSCTNLGVMFFMGTGVAKDERRAAVLFKQGCDGQDPEGCNDSGVILERGAGGVAMDLAQARALYERACDLGSSGGCTNVGMLYANGTGTPKDDARAVSFFARACDGGDGKGCSNLGAMLTNGNGVGQDQPRAVGLFKRACDGGEPTGCSNLGTMYEYGAGVPADRAEAVRLYRLACKQGASIGCSKLSQIGESP